jgi:hypothetical protein
MSNPSGRKGAIAESAFVTHLNITGFPTAERRVTSGANDKGDIGGIPDLTFEIKNQKKYSIGAWLKEADIEKRNAGAEFAPLIVKPVGVGINRVEDWWFILTVKDGLEMLSMLQFGERR